MSNNLCHDCKTEEVYSDALTPGLRIGILRTEMSGLATI